MKTRKLEINSKPIVNGQMNGILSILY